MPLPLRHLRQALDPGIFSHFLGRPGYVPLPLPPFPLLRFFLAMLLLRLSGCLGCDIACADPLPTLVEQTLKSTAALIYFSQTKNADFRIISKKQRFRQD